MIRRTTVARARGRAELHVFFISLVCDENVRECPTMSPLQVHFIYAIWSQPPLEIPPLDTMNGEIFRALKSNNHRLRMRVSQRIWLIGGKDDAWFHVVLFLFSPPSLPPSFSFVLRLERATSKGRREQEPGRAETRQRRWDGSNTSTFFLTPAEHRLNYRPNIPLGRDESEEFSLVVSRALLANCRKENTRGENTRRCAVSSLISKESILADISDIIAIAIAPFDMVHLAIDNAVER